MRRTTVWWTILAAGLVLAGCGDDKNPEAPQVTPVTPEDRMVELQVAYRRYLSDGIDEYAKILAPEFRFYFQDGDAPSGLGRNYWTRDEDSTGTAALFRSPEVTHIEINLSSMKTTVPNEAGIPEGSLKVRVSPTNLVVDDRSGITWEVKGDIQDMYFRKGRLENAGEDTTSWYLFEWRDLPAGYRNSAAPGVGESAVQPATEWMTWGRLKTRYR